MPRFPAPIAPRVLPTPGGVDTRPSAPGPTGGDAIARGLEELGVGTDLARKAIVAAQTEAAKAAATHAEAQLEDSATTLYDDDQQGLLHKIGQDGFQHADTTLGHLEAIRERLEQGLPSDEARQIFRVRSGLIVESRRRQGEKHAWLQRDAVAQQALDDRKDASLRALAMGGFVDPEMRERLIAQPLDMIREREGRFGPAHAEAQVEIFKAKAHAAVLGGMIANRQWQDAREYLGEHLAELGPESRVFQAQIQKGAMQLDADNAARQVIENARAGAFNFVDEGHALDVARAYGATIQDPEEREIFRRSVLGFLKDERAARKGKVRPVWERALGAYNVRRSRSDVNNADLELLNQMDPDARQRLAVIMGEKRGGANDAGLSSTNLMKLKEQLFQDVDHFADGEYDLATFEDEWKHQLTPKDYAKGWDLVLALKKHQEKVGRVPMSEFNRRAQVYADDNGIGSRTGRGKKSRESWMADVWSEYLRWADKPENKGKMPDRDEVNRWFDAYNPAVEYPTGEEGIFGPKTAPLGKLPAAKQERILEGLRPASARGETPRQPVPAAPRAPAPRTQPIPARDREQIIRALQDPRHRQPVTEEAIRSLYERMQRARAAAPPPPRPPPPVASETAEQVRDRVKAQLASEGAQRASDIARAAIEAGVARGEENTTGVGAPAPLAPVGL